MFLRLSGGLALILTLSGGWAPEVSVGLHRPAPPTVATTLGEC